MLLNVHWPHSALQIHKLIFRHAWKLLL